MTDEPLGARPAPDTLRLERVLPGPAERLWRYLTDPTLRGRWLATGPIELRPGGDVTLAFDHATLSAEADPPARFARPGGGPTLHGTLTRCEPPRLLAYTWGDDGEVTFELTPEGDAVRLTVTHVRLAPPSLVMVAAGWHTHLGLLADALADRPPRGFWSTFQRLEATYAEQLGVPSPSEIP